MPVAPQPSDEALFAAYRAGEATALETLFRRYQAPLGRHLARNLARNRLRARRLWGWLPLSDARESVAPPVTGRDEIQQRVAAAFAALPVAQREACSLRLLGELSTEEIARVTRTPLGTVKSRLFHGLRRLRAMLADLKPEE